PRRDGTLLGLLGGGDWQQRLGDFVSRTRHPGPPFFPDFDRLSRFNRRPDGWSFSSAALTPDRQMRRDNENLVLEEEYVMELEVTEEGLLRVIAARATDRTRERGLVVFERMVLGLTYRTVTLAAIISREVGLVGSWDFGVAINGLMGAVSYESG